MADIGWRRRRGSSPAARRGARQRAGLTPVSASNTLSCQRETLHSQQLRSIKKSIDSDHGIYRGAGPVLNDLIPGRVDLYFGSGALLESARTGQIRGLAVTGAEREPAAPDLPTIAEAGLPGFEVSSWQGLFVPAKTPPEIVAKITADARAALADPLVKGKLEQLGYRPVGSTPEELAALLKSDIEKWAAVIKGAGIAIQ